MKALICVGLIFLSCSFISGCSKDDYIYAVDYDIAVILVGDIDEFAWTLALDGYGEQINQLYNPFDLQSNGSFFQTGDLNAETTYSFKASNLDGMSIGFYTSEYESTETYNMSINVVIHKTEYDKRDKASTSQIANFTKSYQRSSSVTGFNEIDFVLKSTKANNNVECTGNACP
ncbi:hypothetical protein VOI54_13940 [Tamlana sp. 2201CG12-4]|uniref:hypothetical protein n=1 Tax=Tamlana sp. 2201CG12-4 TaxID=3112582 RepID=UPI002DBFD934|nr:hypothetical protein [Tamlana sp. 2201CG12-4]MEC3908127.1 hypothetical protein [Tamlana sp. 2201CG12-4]